MALIRGPRSKGNDVATVPFAAICNRFPSGPSPCIYTGGSKRRIGVEFLDESKRIAMRTRLGLDRQRVA